MQILCYCAVPDPQPSLGRMGSKLAEQIQEVSGGRGGIDPKLLREFAEGGSSDWLARKPRSKDEWLKQVSPKYRETVKRYFEDLERLQKNHK